MGRLMSAAHAPVRLVIACLCALALAACGSSGSSSSSGATTGATTEATTGSATSSSAAGGGAASASVITIKDFVFTTPDSVSPGATITVENMDSTAHTVTSDDGDSFDDPAKEGRTSFTAPMEPGSYPFHCNIHPEMHGVLVVK
jgi:plastocyanin